MRVKYLGESGDRLCPRETHGRPWPCEWVARRHCVKRRGERLDVAKTQSERSGKRRDGAKRKVSEGSSLRLTMMTAARSFCLPGSTILISLRALSAVAQPRPPERLPQNAQRRDFLKNPLYSLSKISKACGTIIAFCSPKISNFTS